MFLTPPRSPPLWNHTPAEIVALAKDLVVRNRTLKDKVGALDAKDCNFETVFRALAHGEGHFESVAEPLSFYQHVSPSKEIREASNEAEGLIRDYGIEASIRLDVFQAKAAAEKNIKESGQWEKLTFEEKRLVDKMILDGKRDGLALSEKDRNKLTALKKELSQACLESRKNKNEEKGKISLTEAELDGVPKDVISGYTKRTEGSSEPVYDVTFQDPDISPVFRYAHNPQTRRRAREAYDDRLEINVPLLDKVLDLRRQIAKLLGYKSWADYVTEIKMIKSGDNAHQFLDNLKDKMLPIGIKDRDDVLAFMKKEHEEQGIPFDGEFTLWQKSYYEGRYKEKLLDLDSTAIKEHFPVSVVVPTILEIYQDLLSVRFEEIKGESTWHPDVQPFAVWDKDATDESGFLGYTYLDLAPREGKYSHPSVWPLVSGYDLPDGKRNYPVAPIVASLAKPTADTPALMKHWDVVQLFHEMGHVFHCLLSKTQFSRFHGVNVARDFEEAPSQMLENWCWEPKVLEKLSSHYETKKPLSPELIDKLIKSRYINVGSFYLHQIFLAKYDMKVHTDQDKEDYTLLWNNLRESITFAKYGKVCPGQCGFGHLTGGYDAGYYGYTYSLVYAADMYATVFKADPFDPARGKQYRDKILKWGGSREELDSLEDFLGRKPDADAFLKQIFPSSSL